jgi:hypothetical protein
LEGEGQKQVSTFSSAASLKGGQLIENETNEHRTLNIERPILMALRFIYFIKEDLGEDVILRKQNIEST